MQKSCIATEVGDSLYRPTMLSVVPQATQIPIALLCTQSHLSAPSHVQQPIIAAGSTRSGTQMHKHHVLTTPHIHPQGQSPLHCLSLSTPHHMPHAPRAGLADSSQPVWVAALQLWQSVADRQDQGGGLNGSGMVATALSPPWSHLTLLFLQGPTTA